MCTRTPRDRAMLAVQNNLKEVLGVPHLRLSKNVEMMNKKQIKDEA